MKENFDYDKALAVIERQERELLLASFDHAVAWEMGVIARDLGASKRLPVAIQISRLDQVIFHSALEGTSRDNDDWLMRKRNVVRRYQCSSYKVGLRLRKDRLSQADLGLPIERFAAAGGGFPLNLKNFGTVGSLVISGLPEASDHDFAVSVVARFMGNEAFSSLLP